MVGNHLLNLFPFFVRVLFARPQNLRLIFTETPRSTRPEREGHFSRPPSLFSSLPSVPVSVVRWLGLVHSIRTWPVRKHAKQRLPHAESHFDGPTNSFTPAPPLSLTHPPRPGLASSSGYKPPKGTPGAFNPPGHTWPTSIQFNFQL